MQLTELNNNYRDNAHHKALAAELQNKVSFFYSQSVSQSKGMNSMVTTIQKKLAKKSYTSDQ